MSRRVALSSTREARKFGGRNVAQNQAVTEQKISPKDCLSCGFEGEMKDEHPRPGAQPGKNQGFPVRPGPPLSRPSTGLQMRRKWHWKRTPAISVFSTGYAGASKIF